MVINVVGVLYGYVGADAHAWGGAGGGREMFESVGGWVVGGSFCA